MVISLTDFIDFVCKAGTAKLTKVRQVKERDDYSPATDFYKPLREALINCHKSDDDKKYLDEFLKSITDRKKVSNYAEVIAGYKKFWGRKKLTWFNPPSKNWKVGDLTIKINPELGLEIDSNFYVIKLYFKKDKLTKDRISQILSLMEKQLRDKVKDEEVKFAVLDVKNSKLHVNEDLSAALFPLLEGEAKSFEIIWNSL